MAQKEDIRITKTKAALTNAFYAMIAENDVDDITVNELCARANVRRATFYKHFKDKLDFLTYLIRDIRETFDRETFAGDPSPSITADYYINYISALGKFLSEREEAVSKILRSSLGPIFLYTFMHQNYIDTSKKLQISVGDGMALPSSLPVVASMLIGGVSHNILRWFELENRPPIDTLVEDMKLFFKTALDKHFEHNS